MPKANIKWMFNNHSTEKFFERTALNVTKKQIAKAIMNNQIVPFKRINTSRTMTYVHVNSEVIKTVMHKKKKKIITILPWKSIYQCIIELCIQKFNNTTYKIHIFPDCYMETKKQNSLTKIYSKVPYISTGTFGWDKMAWNDPLFKEVFRLAWDYFKKDEEHINIRKQRRKGIETFEIRGKAKEIKTTIECTTYCEEDQGRPIV